MKRLAVATALILLTASGIAAAQAPSSPPGVRAPAPEILQPNTPVGPTNPAPSPALDTGLPAPSIVGTPPLGTVGPLDGLPSINSGTMNPPPPATKPTP